MGTIDLNNRLDDSLFYTLHSIKLFIQDTACFLRVNRFKVIMLPLNVHHNGKRSLCMASLLLRNLVGAGHCQISSCPEADIIRHGFSCTGHKVRNTLDAGQLHIVAVLILVFILIYFCRCAAYKKTVDHKLEKTILC